MPPTLEAVRRFVRTQLRLCFGGGIAPVAPRAASGRHHGAQMSLGRYGAVSRRDLVSNRGPQNARLVGVGVVEELGSAVEG
jgi:hypothetical protein